MRAKLPIFVKLPSQWIEDGGLKPFSWRRSGSDATAALMLLAVIAHHADPDDGMAHLTYEQLTFMAHLSRAKVSGGLSILAARKLVERMPDGRSSHRLSNYDPDQGWAKFPARGLYRNGSVAAFQDFKLRVPAELDAMKLYFLFAARRSRQTNMAAISYEKIEAFSGVRQDRIKTALSILSTNDLIHTERFPSRISDSGISHAYRLTHLDTRRHLGTIGRSLGGDLEIALEDA